MRRTLVALLLSACSALAADFAGRWRGEAVIDGQTAPVYVTLLVEGATVKGTGGPTPNDQDPVANGKIEGNRVSFDVTPGRTSPLHFELSSDGEWLKGTVKVKHNGQMVTGTVALRRRTS
jgi:hypothetical protein